ncbi:hypothetical protein ACTHGU_12785 [Chitinophagaceae bacterium MMS25-I14]
MKTHFRSSYFLFYLLLCAYLASGQKSTDGPLAITALRDTILVNRALLLPGPFDGEKALRALFPGKYYDLSKRSGYSNKLINWRCTGCTSKQYVDVNDDAAPPFPFSEGVATRLINVMDLKDANGGEYKMIAFNHSAYDEDGMQTSRFTGGLLGLAKFAKTENGWLLRSFQPAIGAYGAFSSCPSPKPLLIGEDQYAFLLKHNNGPGGGPFDASYFLIAGANGTYSQVMAAYRIERTNTEENESNWTADLPIVTGDKKYFKDLRITVHGVYYANKYEDDILTEIKDRLKGIKSCTFSYELTFVYSGAKGYQSKGADHITLTDVKK